MSENARNTNPERHVHLRPAKVGDICILLEPTAQADVERLRERQLALRAQFGGTPIEHVHLTVERFACPEKKKIDALAERLRRSLAPIDPFTLTACALKTLYVQALECHILKWEIDVPPELERLVELAKATLSELGIVSLYAPGFVSSLVTALRELPEPLPDRFECDIPYVLFTVSRVQLSEILGPNAFEILATIDLREQT